jgi:hypothetical protein
VLVKLNSGLDLKKSLGWIGSRESNKSKGFLIDLPSHKKQINRLLGFTGGHAQNDLLLPLAAGKQGADGEHDGWWD